MAVETALCMLECTEPVNPLDIVRVMRNQRGMLIQTPVRRLYDSLVIIILQCLCRHNTSLSVKVFSEHTKVNSF